MLLILILISINNVMF